MLRDWYGSVGEDIMTMAMINELELTYTDNQIIQDYWTSIGVLHAAFRDILRLNDTTGPATPHLYDWIQQIEEHQFWSDLHQWSLNFDAALSMTITLQEANKQGPNSGASPFVRGSGIGARTESGGQKRKVSEVELSSPPPMKRVRPSSPRRAPSVGPRIDNYRSSTDSVGQLASSSSSILFEGSFTRHTSHTDMLSPSTTVSDLDEQSTMSSNSTPTKMARIPRPANSFILFRSHYCKKYMPSEPASQTNISAVTGAAWKLLPREEKDFWQQRANEAKEQHMRDYPDYRYRPYNGDKKTKPKTKRKRSQGHLQWVGHS